MLKNCKLSKYKIKKILEHYAEDFTALETSRMLKFNKKTVDRYFKIFRKILLNISITQLKQDLDAAKHIGWIKGEYGEKCYFKIYKKDEKTFFCTKLDEKPLKSVSATHDEDFCKYLDFIHQRLSKFYGLTEESYHYQLFESIIKYKFPKDYLIDVVWKNLNQAPKKDKMTSKNLKVR